jgi:hypothetical protein
MRFQLTSVLVLLGAGFAGLLIASSSVSPPEAPPVGAAEPAAGPPPLMIEEDAPLLEDVPRQTNRRARKRLEQQADNSACFVCHDNYRQENLAVWHADVNVGCAYCHGESFAHRNDENNTTPPEVMYSRERIECLCVDCHATHDAPAADVVARFLEKFPPTADPRAAQCTDCHGEHRLRVRTVNWDKGTGKLLTTAGKAATSPLP